MESYLYQDLFNLEEQHFWHIAKRALAIDIIKRFVKKGPLTFCDIGCGTGKNLEVFGQFGTGWGVDLSEEALAFCRKRRLVNLRQGVSEKTGFKAGQFDLVTMLDVLEHTDDEKSLVEMRRILKKDGYLLIGVPAYQWLWSPWDEVLHHKRRYNRKDLQKLLSRHDFSVIFSSYAFSYLFLPLILTRFIKSFFGKTSYGSDFALNNLLINQIGLLLSAVERGIMKYFPLPFGTSVVVLAVKKVLSS